MLSPYWSATIPEASRRLVSIDVLRGFTVAFMILVNNAGDGNASYQQLRHSVWNGCTLTDLVFPLFLFIMGVSTAISFQSRVARGTKRGMIAAQVCKRSVFIILIGLTLNALPIPHLATLRYCGVMQRIGLCYLFAGLVLLYLRPMGVVIVTALCVFGYWLLLTAVPVPGFGKPGIDIPVLDPTGNLASYLDRMLIPKAHRYHFSFYDPEGALSTLSALATTCCGILAGHWTRYKEVSSSRKLIAMAVAAVLLIASGLLWSETFPLNKRLWTSSYVLFAAGISLGMLALLTWAVDIKHWLNGLLSPLLAFGSNALTAYIFSELLGIALDSIPIPRYGTLQRFTYFLIPAFAGSPALRSLIWSVLFVAVCFLPIWWLFCRKMVIKL